jgi:hypothetical protein
VALTTLLVWVLIAEGCLWAIAVVLFFAHGWWLQWHTRRQEARLNEARGMLNAMLAHYAFQRSTLAWFYSLPVQQLYLLPRRLQIRLFEEFAPKLSGQQQQGLRDLSDWFGLIVSAEFLCASWFWWRRLRGARLLTLWGGGERVMLPLFRDRFLIVRAQAATWAAGHPSPVVIDALVTLLGDTSRLCRFTAQNALAQLSAMTVSLAHNPAEEASRPSQMVLDALLAVLRCALSPACPPPPSPQSRPWRRWSGPPSGSRASPTEVQIAAVLEIATRLVASRFLDPVLALCQHPAPHIRSLAALFLGALGGTMGIERLFTLLTDSDADVRAAAARALGRLGHWPAASRLAPLLRDRVWAVRREAGLALRTLGAPGLLFLRRSLADGDRFAADMARHILDLPGPADSEVGP